MRRVRMRSPKRLDGVLATIALVALCVLRNQHADVGRPAHAIRRRATVYIVGKLSCEDDAGLYLVPIRFKHIFPFLIDDLGYSCYNANR